MNTSLEGRVALVAAASKGLGYASALEIARNGAKVAICARSEGPLNEAARRITEETGQEVIALPGDVTSAAEPERLVRETVSRLGRLDILMPNSGGPPAGSFESLDDAAWQSALDSTLLMTIRFIRAALPTLKESNAGRIIVITSTSARQPIPGLLTSNTLRAGILGLLKTLSLEFAPYHITVNNLAPGSYDTDRLKHLHQINAEKAGISVEEARHQAEQRIPLGRLGRPEELGAMAAFLASDAGGYITGQTILVDGGQTLGI